MSAWHSRWGTLHSSALSELVSSADWPLDLIEWDSNTKVTLLGIKVGPVVMAMICRKPGFVWICCANLRVESRCNWCIYGLHMMWMWIRNMEHADNPMLLAVLCSGFCICPKKIFYEACWWAASRLRSRDTRDGLCFVAKCQRFHSVQWKALGGGSGFNDSLFSALPGRWSNLTKGDDFSDGLKPPTRAKLHVIPLSNQSVKDFWGGHLWISVFWTMSNLRMFKRTLTSTRYFAWEIMIAFETCNDTMTSFLNGRRLFLQYMIEYVCSTYVYIFARTCY